MPIRTNRGRAAVYRRVWGWPLRSPRHLVGAIVGVVVVCVGIAVILARTAPPPRQLAHAGVPTAAPSVDIKEPSVNPTPLPDRITAVPAPSLTTPDPAALTVATAWARAWVNHPQGVTNAAWLAGMKPYTTDEYLPVMSSVDPANVPATKVTGDATAVRAYNSSVQASVDTDGGTLDITVVKTPQGWRVASYNKG